MTLALAVALGGLLVLGLAERVSRDRARRDVPIRVHVNGTRGKSTVTRMIWSALLEAGVPAVAKTTGTAPRLLLPDRTEQAIRRRAPASIREQLWFLRRARRLGARAAVAECMAVNPALQWIAEREMIGATIGVITNVRTDHLESMGDTLDTIAESLANTIPPGGTLITGDERFFDLFERRARAVGARVVLARKLAIGDNEAVALAACRALGLVDEIALRGIARAPSDPGALRSGELAGHERTVRWLDASSANDPESLDQLVAAWEGLPLGAGEPGADPAADHPAVVFNHRADRPLRLEAFRNLSVVVRKAPCLVVTGERPSWPSWKHLRASRPSGWTRYVAARRLAEVLATLCRTAGGPSALVFAGNTKRLDVSRLVATLRPAPAACGPEASGQTRP